MHIALQRERESRRDESLRLVMWMFLSTVAMLFAAFSSAYVVRRSGTDWAPIQLPNVVWVNTLVLGLSSFALELGSWNGSRRRWTLALYGLGSAFVLGIGFLIGQVRAWQQLQAVGVYLPSTPHSSFFYLLTVAHSIHVIGALAVLGYVCVIAMGSARVDARRWSNATAMARTFWHFLLGVWLAVLVLLQL